MRRGRCLNVFPFVLGEHDPRSENHPPSDPPRIYFGNRRRDCTTLQSQAAVQSQRRGFEGNGEIRERFRRFTTRERTLVGTRDLEIPIRRDRRLGTSSKRDENHARRDATLVQPFHNVFGVPMLSYAVYRVLEK